jgi:hypothetical protein
MDDGCSCAFWVFVILLLIVLSILAATGVIS